VKNGSASVTSLAGLNLEPSDAITKLFLSLLDGTRSPHELLKELDRAVETPPNDIGDFRRTLPGMVEMRLAKFAEAALLIA
jgi:hypothetical protein